MSGMLMERPETLVVIAQVPAGPGSGVDAEDWGDLPTSRMPQLVSAPAAAVPNDSKINAIPARIISNPLRSESRITQN